MSSQRAKAQSLKTLHDNPEQLLILPNVWDVMSTRLLTNLGYPAIATASAAIAFSRGYDDGQQIPLEEMLKVIEGITSSTTVPVTADFERGYAEDLRELKGNIRRLIEVGAVGLNLEDSVEEGGALRPIEAQTERIAAVRAVAEEAGVPLVINARCDCFLQDELPPVEMQIEDSIARGLSYAKAGADCFYPILLEGKAHLATVAREVPLPINVLATRSNIPHRDLLNLGVRRLSLGPGWLKAGVSEMARVARALLEGHGFPEIDRTTLSSPETRQLLSRT